MLEECVCSEAAAAALQEVKSAAIRPGVGMQQGLGPLHRGSVARGCPLGVWVALLTGEISSHPALTWVKTGSLNVLSQGFRSRCSR